MRIVQQHIGIQHEVLHHSSRGRAVGFDKFWKKYSLFLIWFQYGRTVHVVGYGVFGVGGGDEGRSSDRTSKQGRGINNAVLIEPLKTSALICQQIPTSQA
jgi:hypothetical protein